MAIEQRVARVEGIVEQVNERLEDLRVQGQDLRMELRNKADRWELRMWALTILALLAAILGVLVAR